MIQQPAALLPTGTRNPYEGGFLKGYPICPPRPPPPQVLVSIHALIFVAEPYYNEPGYEARKGTAAGDQGHHWGPTSTQALPGGVRGFRGGGGKPFFSYRGDTATPGYLVAVNIIESSVPVGFGWFQASFEGR